MGFSIRRCLLPRWVRTVSARWTPVSALLHNSPFFVPHRRTLTQLVDDLAAQLAVEMHRGGFDEVAVVDFEVSAAEEQATANLPGVDYGPLVRVTTEQLARGLRQRSNFGYRVVSPEWLRNLLLRKQFGFDDLRTPRMSELKREVDTELQRRGGAGKMAVVLTRLTHRDAAVVVLDAAVWNAAAGVNVANFEADGLLQPVEWGMIGRSSFVSTEFRDTNFTVPTPQVPGKPGPQAHPTPTTIDFFSNKKMAESVIEATVRAQADSQQRPHPMSEATFPYRIYLTSRGGRIKETFAGPHCYAVVDLGVTYQIHILNQSGAPCFLVLLVDGRNTLPEVPLNPRNGLYVARDDSLSPQAQQFVSLNRARPWYCHEDSQHYCVAGYYREIGTPGADGWADSKYNEFQVVDATHSLAWRSGFTRDVGIITAAFFQAVPKSECLSSEEVVAGTIPGAERTGRLERYLGPLAPGKLLTIVQLRYGVRPN